MALFSLSPIFLMTLVTHDTHDHQRISIKDFPDCSQTVVRGFAQGLQCACERADEERSLTYCYKIDG